MKINSRKVPDLVQVVVDSSCYTIQLWWELPSWFSVVILKEASKDGEVGEDVGVGSHASVRLKEWKWTVKRRVENVSLSQHKRPEFFQKGVAKGGLLEKGGGPINCNITLVGKVRVEGRSPLLGH